MKQADDPWARSAAKHLLLKHYDEAFGGNQFRGQSMIATLEELHALIASFPPSTWSSEFDRARGELIVSVAGGQKGPIKLTALKVGVKIERGSKNHSIVLHTDYATNRTIHEEWSVFSPTATFTPGIQKVVEALLTFKPF